MDSVGSTSLYEVSAQPVILTWFSHVTDIKGSDQTFLVIQYTYLIPLQWIYGRQKEEEIVKKKIDSVFNCTKNIGQAFFFSSLLLAKN